MAVSIGPGVNKPKINLFDFSKPSQSVGIRPSNTNITGLSMPQSTKTPKSIGPGIVPQSQGAKTLFVNERTALDAMKNDGIDEETALKAITEKRKTLLGSITQNEAKALSAMANDDVDINQAVEAIRQKRYSDLPAYKKALKVPFDATVGSLGMVAEQIGNVGGFLGAEGMQKTGEDIRNITSRTTGDSKAAKAGEIITGAGELFAAAPAKIAPTLLGRTAQGALAGGVAGGGMEILGEGSDTTLGEVGKETLKGAALGAVATPVIEKVAIPGIVGSAKLLKNLPKNTKDLATKIKSGELTQNAAYGVSARANRMNAVDIEKFQKMTGEHPGQFAVDRGMTKVGDAAVEETAKLFQKSMKEADNAFNSIDGTFTMKGQAVDFIEGAFEGLQKKLTKFSPSMKRVNQLFTKYQNEGLSMNEINELKRLYANNHKYSFVQAGSKSAVKSKDIQDGLRKWQFEVAAENGLENIAEINKNTQAWKAYSDMLGKKLARSSDNNAISLTDWIVLSGGEPTNLALFLGKKAGATDFVKSGTIKKLSKSKKPSIIKRDKDAILKSNLQKRYGTNTNISRSGGRSSTSKPVKGLLPVGTTQNAPKTIIQPSKKPILLKPQTNNPKIVNPQSISRINNLIKKVFSLDNKTVKKLSQQIGDTLGVPKEKIESIIRDYISEYGKKTVTENSNLKDYILNQLK